MLQEVLRAVPQEQLQQRLEPLRAVSVQEPMEVQPQAEAELQQEEVLVEPLQQQAHQQAQ